MKRIFWGLFFTVLVSTNVFAIEKVLPQPEQSGGKPLMEVLKQRRSNREFSNKAIDEQTLSNLLWAAYGVSSQDGKRTIPTAMNKKELDIYVAAGKGVWLYDADANKLKQVNDKNILGLFKTQDYMTDVPLVLIYVGDKNVRYADMHAGSAYQNVSLYTTSIGMNSVVRGYFDTDKVAKELNLANTKKIIISQAVGWGK